MKYSTNPPLGTPLNIAHPFNRGLTGYWPFAEGAGGRTADLGLKAARGTLTNGPTWTGGRFGSALRFDGVDDYVTADTNLEIAGQATILFWVRAAAVDAQALNYPISLGLNGAYGWSIWVGGTYAPANSMGIYDGTNASGTVADTFTPNDIGVDRHLAFVYDNTRAVRMSIYKDLVPQVMDTNNITGLGPAQNQINIGRRMDNQFYWNGLLYGLRVFNRALDISEIKGIYAQEFCMYERENKFRWYFPVAASGFQPARARNNNLIGGGF